MTLCSDKRRMRIALDQNDVMADVSSKRPRDAQASKLINGSTYRLKRRSLGDAGELTQSASDSSNLRLAYVAVGVLAALAALITAYATKQGVGLAFDSINYLTAANNLGNGHGLRTGTLEPFTIAPPGLSALLAPAVWVGWNEESAARLAGIVCYAATVVLAFVLARRHIRSLAASVFVAAVTAASSSLLFVMTLALTEPMFIVVVLSFILVAERVWRHWSINGLLAMVALTWLAFSFRYLGLFLVPCGIICVLVSSRANRLHAVARAGAFAIGSLAFPLIWMVRNHAADGTLMGPRPGSLQTFAGVRSRFVDVLQIWAWPAVTTTWLHWLALAVAVCVTAVLWVRRKNIQLPSVSAPRSSLWPIAIVSVLYLAYLIYGELTTAVDPIDRRLMSPLFVPTLVVLVRLIEGMGVRIPSAIPFLAGGASLLLVVQGASTFDAAKVGAEKGILMQTDEFRKEPQALALAGIGKHDVVYSNVRMNFWIALRHQPARYWPRHFAHYSPTTLDEIPAFLESLGCGPAYAVWYGKESDPPGEYLSPTELMQFVNLKPLQTFPTGINYIIEPKQPVPPKTEAECREMNLRL